MKPDVKKPIVMFGDTRSDENIELLSRRGWGRMFCTEKPTPFPFEKWGFDNQAFIAWKDAGFPFGLTRPDWAILWDADEFERRVREAQDIAAVTCDPYMAVAPDIPAGGRESLLWSLQWIGDLPGNWPWYLAVQDGMTHDEVAENLHMFDGIFLGGSDRFKLTAFGWAELARKWKKKFHYGRSGTTRKLLHAYRVGADSLDSTFASWTRERTRKLCAQWDGLELQGEMSSKFIAPPERKGG